MRSRIVKLNPPFKIGAAPNGPDGEELTPVLFDDYFYFATV